MNREEAKEILTLYRPGIDDPSEPDIAAALDLAKEDAELARWFAAESALYKATREKFKEVAVPNELLGRLLSTPRRRAEWWRSPVLWAAAAAILLFVGVMISLPSGEKGYTFGAFRSKMVRTAMRNYDMPLMTNNLAVIRTYLTTNNAHGDYVLTPALAKLPGEGCVIFPWHSRTVSLVCLDGGQGRDVFLFVINRTAVADPPADKEIQTVGKLPTAAWTEGDKTYLLATKGDERFLRSLLPTP